MLNLNSCGQMDIIINGKKITVKGNSVIIDNGKIVVDGQLLEDGLPGRCLWQR